MTMAALENTPPFIRSPFLKCKEEISARQFNDSSPLLLRISSLRRFLCLRFLSSPLSSSIFTSVYHLPFALLQASLFRTVRST